MNALELFDVPVGSQISVDGDEIKVVGKFTERYITEDGIIADAYVLALDQRQEVGSERRGNEWHMWYSRFSRTCPAGSLTRVMGTLGNVERGIIEKGYSEGEVGESYPRYAFGKKIGMGVFLGIKDDTFDVWVNTRPDEIKVL